MCPPISGKVTPALGAPRIADVDIMGNHELIKDILQVAAGKLIENRIISEVEEISKRVKLPPSIV